MAVTRWRDSRVGLRAGRREAGGQQVKRFPSVVAVQFLEQQWATTERQSDSPRMSSTSKQTSGLARIRVSLRPSAEWP